MIIVLYIDNFIDIFRAGCNSEADSTVWMKEDKR